MNKFIKHVLCLGLLGLASIAVAQVHMPEAEKFRISTQGGQQSLPPPQPTGYWVKTWGAIAPSPKGGILGTAVGADSKEEAERIALADCKKKGGQSCKVDIAYRNQCAVMIIGNQFINTARAATISEASDFGIRYCKEKDTNCRVYYSACTEPRFVKY